MKYYSIVQEPVNASVTEAKIPDEQKLQLEKMQEELALSKKSHAEKDKQLLQLNTELKTIRENQKKINTVLNSDDFTRLMKKG